MAETNKPIKWADQIAHFVSCFFLTLLTFGFGAPIAALWAITREYYQTKITMYEVYRIEYPDLNWKQIGKQLTYKKVMELVDLKKRDLMVSYAGIVTALLINVPFNIWLYMEVL